MTLNSIKTNNPINKCAEDLNRHFSREDIQIAKRHMKRCSTWLMQIKTLSPYTSQNGHYQKSTNNKYCRRCGEKGTHLQCWWECKLVQPLWRTVWRFSKKLKIELPYDPAIPFLGIYLEKIIIQRYRHSNVCSAGLFTIAKTWKQPKCNRGMGKDMVHIFVVVTV